MSEALDNARAARAAIRDNANYGDGGIDNRVLEKIEDALEALIAENERLTKSHDRYKFDAENLVEQVESLTAPPTDAERETLRSLEYKLASHRVGPDRANVRNASDVALAAEIAAGFRRQGPVTDADLGIMAQRFYEVANESPDITFHSMTVKPVIVGALRAALEAARG